MEKVSFTKIQIAISKLYEAALDGDKEKILAAHSAAHDEVEKTKRVLNDNRQLLYEIAARL